MSQEPVPQKQTCCLMRRKTILLLGPIIPEDACGIPDSVLADFMRFDLQGPVFVEGQRAKPVISFAFCPWCGAPRTENSETRITDVQPPPDDGSGEEWKSLPDE